MTRGTRSMFIFKALWMNCMVSLMDFSPPLCTKNGTILPKSEKHVSMLHPWSKKAFSLKWYRLVTTHGIVSSTPITTSYSFYSKNWKIFVLLHTYLLKFSSSHAIFAKTQTQFFLTTSDSHSDTIISETCSRRPMSSLQRWWIVGELLLAEIPISRLVISAFKRSA